MSNGRQVYITWDGGSVYFRGDHPEKTGLFVTGDGIEGWSSAPTDKVQMTEMQTRDGAYPLSDDDILYSSRTVTVNFRARGSNRDEVLSLIQSVAEACHRVVKIRVIDGSSDTYCEGYTSHSIEAEWNERWGVGSLTVVCPNPIRLSTSVKRIFLKPAQSTQGGLGFGTGEGLVFDLNYGGNAEELQNIGTLQNDGTSVAYPILTVTGEMQGGFFIETEQGTVAYSQPVGMVPLVLDSSSRVATIEGLDVSRHLTSREFPSLRPGESLQFNLQGTGTGYVTVELRDAYI